MFENSEIEEIKEILQQRKIAYTQFLEEKLAPMQHKMAASAGQVVATVARHYARASCGAAPPVYSLDTILSVGMITPETRFPSKEEGYSNILVNVKNPHHLNLHLGDCSIKEGWFYGSAGGVNIFFMGKPPRVPEDSWYQSCFGRRSTTQQTDKPRLEMYVGNQEALPYLEQRLKGWQYAQFSELLDCGLPMTNMVIKKAEQEQCELFDEVMGIENCIRSFSRQQEARMGEVSATGGVIHHATHVELTDEMAENMHYNPKMRNHRERLMGLIQTAVQRRYHVAGMEVERRLDKGAIMKINLRDFFTQRKAMLKL